MTVKLVDYVLKIYLLFIFNLSNGLRSALNLDKSVQCRGKTEQRLKPNTVNLEDTGEPT